MKALFNRQMISQFIFMLFGMLFFAIGSGLTIRQRTLEKQGIESQGMVVDLQGNSDSDGSSYAPVVQLNLFHPIHPVHQITMLAKT